VDALGESQEAAGARAVCPGLVRVGFTIHGPIEPADLPGLCDRLLRLLRLTGATCVDCVTDPLVRPDAVAVDAVARLQLAAQRSAARIRLRETSAELRDLMTFMALDVVTGTEGPVD
jgi:hypothetical protein